MHIPVLQKEILEILKPKENENFIDCTINGGGHSFTILDKNGPSGKILGIEADPSLYNRLIEKVKNENPETEKRLILENDNFVHLKEIVKKHNFSQVSGILFDLGISSLQLEESGRGFTFLKEEPLIMRYDGRTEDLTAEKILNNYPQEDLEKIFKEYGEEKFAKRIAKAITTERKLRSIKTTFELRHIIKEAVPARYHFSKIHFATRTFQALRIAVNNELENLKEVLPQAIDALKSGGKIAVISFHSLEDRIVKDFFRENMKKGIIETLTKKPIRPSFQEIQINNRSRSAKLRAAMKK